MRTTSDAAGNSADTGTYRRARSCASCQRSDAGAQQRTASRSAEHLPIPAVSTCIFLRISIAVDGRRLGAKFFSADHPKNSYPTHHKKNLRVVHDIIPALVPFRSFRLKRAFDISNYLRAPSIQKLLSLQTRAFGTGIGPSHEQGVYLVTPRA